MDGYKIIDFKGVVVSDGGSVPGIYNAIDESTKPIVVANVGLESGIKVIKPYYTMAIQRSTSPTTNAYYIPFLWSDGLQNFILVNDDDSIELYEA